MRSLVFFAQRIVIGALLLALLALAFLYRPTTLDVWLAVWHTLLNGGNCALLLVVLIARVYLSTGRRAGLYAGTPWPASIATVLLGASLISTTMIYAVVAFGGSVVAPLKWWLDIFNLTDIATSGVVIAMTALFPRKIDALIPRIGQCVIIVCLTVAVILLPAVIGAVNDAAYGPADDYAAELIPVIWVNLAGLTVVIGFLNWRNPSLGFAAIGAAAATMTFAAAVCYTLLPPDLEPPVGGWHAVAATAAPLPLFLAILMRRRRPLSETGT